MTDQRISLGDRVRDSISGFIGICVARTEWLNGCVRVVVQPEKCDPNTGKPHDDQVFDECQVELVEPGVFSTPGSTQHNAPRPPGGPARGEETHRPGSLRRRLT